MNGRPGTHGETLQPLLEDNRFQVRPTEETRGLSGLLHNTGLQLTGRPGTALATSSRYNLLRAAERPATSLAFRQGRARPPRS